MISGPRAARYVEEADRALSEAYEEPMSLSEFVEAVFSNPRLASHASKYLLDAITSTGTRTVVEGGEERERYRFFDDPHNDGEHAVLGNTETLNAFVDDLRAIATGRGKAESIIWFAGPTATGKSELKRCLINGLRAYSMTPEGRRYTVEWNVEPAEDTRGLSYGEERLPDEDGWHESPVQSNPLSVFPPEVREGLVEDVNRETDAGMAVRVEAGLDPFSREAYDHLEKRYRDKRESDLLSAIAADRHLRVTNYVVDVGRGVGVLHPEDGGSVKERLVGGWMPELLRELDSRGRKNPQAFSYDGVLSQGNNGVTIVEDASQHADLLQKLLSVPEEGRVKLDVGIGMDVDTQLIVISNPDLEALLDQHESRKGRDPLKALKRRLDKRELTYLTSLSLEVQLIRRELTEETAVWELTDDEAVDARVREPLVVAVHDGHAGAGGGSSPDDGAIEREFAPHAIEAAAMYDVVTRIGDDDLGGDLDLADKARLYDRGYLQVGDERLDFEDFDLDDERDGEHGIPVTYTRDVLAELVATERDRHHDDLPVGDVVMPQDVLTGMADGLADAPVFGKHERSEFEDRVVPVEAYVLERQEEDVLEAMLAGHQVDEETVAEYVEHVYAWSMDEPIESDRGEAIEADPLVAKVFEIEHLGRFSEGDYDGTDPNDDVAAFRREQVITALNRHAWERRGEDFRVGDVDLTEVPAIAEVIASNDWDDVRRIFPDLDPRRWEDPPSGTETARVKAETIERLVDRGYSRASAELTSRRVLEEASRRWDDGRSAGDEGRDGGEARRGAGDGEGGE